MSRFRVVVTIPLFIEFKDSEKPTEKTAVYIAEKIGVNFIRKSGMAREVGWFSVEGQDHEIKIVSVERLGVAKSKEGLIK